MAAEFSPLGQVHVSSLPRARHTSPSVAVGLQHTPCCGDSQDKQLLDPQHLPFPRNGRASHESCLCFQKVTRLVAGLTLAHWCLGLQGRHWGPLAPRSLTCRVPLPKDSHRAASSTEAPFRAAAWAAAREATEERERLGAVTRGTTRVARRGQDGRRSDHLTQAVRGTGEASGLISISNGVHGGHSVGSFLLVLGPWSRLQNTDHTIADLTADPEWITRFPSRGLQVWSVSSQSNLWAEA